MSKQEFNFVTGYVNNIGSTIIKDGVGFAVDYEKSAITLERIREIYQKACEFAGLTFDKITLNHSVYSKTDGNECGDFPETCYLDKKFNYDPKTNSMQFFDKGEPVYANDNGVITKDQAALYDCMGDI